MTAFELFFGLTSVILALALTHLANSFQLLLRAGRRVRWAIEPLLQSALILMIVVFIWVDQWSVREETTFTLSQCILQVVKLLAVYVAAAAVLPEPRETENLDLRDYYMSSRRVTYGALLAGLVLFIAYRFLYLPAEHVPLNNSVPYAVGIPLLYVFMMVVRWRPFHVAALIVLCLAYAVQIAPMRIGG
jgi:hypothetical protein